MRGREGWMFPSESPINSLFRLQEFRCSCFNFQNKAAQYCIAVSCRDSFEPSRPATESVALDPDSSHAGFGGAGICFICLIRVLARS